MQRFILTAAALAVTGAASAAPLNPQQVLPEARWVVHIDVEGLMRSSFTRNSLTERAILEMNGEFQQFKEQFGINPTTDLHGITLFGLDAGENEGAFDNLEEKVLIVVNATDAIDQPFAKLEGIVPDYRTVKEGERTIHSWSDDDETMYAYAKPGAGGANRVVLISPDLDNLKKSMLAMEQAGAPTPEVISSAPPQSGSLFYFRALELPGDIADDETVSSILRLAQSITIDTGENAGRVYMNGTLNTNNADEANNLSQMLLGVIALGRMAAADDADLKPLLDLVSACRVTTEGSALRVQFDYDAERLSAIIRDLDDNHTATTEEDERKIRELEEVLKATESKPE